MGKKSPSVNLHQKKEEKGEAALVLAPNEYLDLMNESRRHASRSHNDCCDVDRPLPIVPFPSLTLCYSSGHPFLDYWKRQMDSCSAGPPTQCSVMSMHKNNIPYKPLTRSDALILVSKDRTMGKKFHHLLDQSHISDSSHPGPFLIQSSTRTLTSHLFDPNDITWEMSLWAF